MARNWFMVLLCATTVVGLGGCTGHGRQSTLPAEETFLTYPGDDLGAAEANANTACAAYHQKAALVGTPTAPDGSKIATFKCR